MSDIQDKKTTIFIRSKWVEWIFVNLPFVCYLAFLGVLYIFNVHAVEKSLRRIDTLKKEVNDERLQHMGIKQELMFGSTQSQLSKNLEDHGLQPNKSFPKKLKLTEDKGKK